MAGGTPIAIQDLNSLATLGLTDIFIVDNGTETQTSDLDTLVRFLENELNIPVTIADVAGLQAILDDKAALNHTHLISQVEGLQTILDTKYDATNAGINGTVVFIGPNSISIGDLIDERITDLTGVSPTDNRIPGEVTVGNFLQFITTEGGIGEVTGQQLKTDLLLNNVENTSDLDKPVSAAQQTALDLKGDGLGLVELMNGNQQLQLLSGMTVLATAELEAGGGSGTTYTLQQNADNIVLVASTDDADDITIPLSSNTLAGLMSRQDKTKLTNIEALADVTDTDNVWSSLGISTGGSTTRVLTERGIFVGLDSIVVSKSAVDSAIGATTGESSLFYTQAGTWALVTGDGVISKDTIDGVIGANTEDSTLFYNQEGEWAVPNVDFVQDPTTIGPARYNPNTGQYIVHPTGALQSWYPGTDYAVDDLVEFGPYLYICIQAHTSASTQTPPQNIFANTQHDATPTQTSNVNWVLDGSFVLDWTEGMAYLKGQVVSHNFFGQTKQFKSLFSLTSAQTTGDTNTPERRAAERASADETIYIWWEPALGEDFDGIGSYQVFHWPDEYPGDGWFVRNGQHIEYKDDIYIFDHPSFDPNVAVNVANEAAYMTFTPSDASNFWRKVKPDNAWSGFSNYSAGALVTYNSGAYVRTGGDVTKALAANAAPDTDGSGWSLIQSGGADISESDLEDLMNVIGTDLPGNHDLAEDRMLIYDATDDIWKRIGLVELANAIGGGGAGLPNISAFTVNDNTADAGGQTITGTITGTEGTAYTIAISDATGGFITDTALSTTSGTITGTSDTFTITVPALNTATTRSFNVTVTNDLLSSNSIVRTISQTGAGNLTGITSNVSVINTIAGIFNITVSGVVGTTFNLSLTGETSTASLGAVTSGTIPADGTFETTVSVGTTLYTDVDLDFNVVATNTADNTNTVSVALSHTYAQPRLTSVTLSNLVFGQDGETADVTVTGGVGAQFAFSIVSVDPAGWITSAALGATSGTIPSDGTFETTITIPFASSTVNRIFNLRATNSNLSTNIVTSGLIRQQVSAELSATFTPLVYPFSKYFDSPGTKQLRDIGAHGIRVFNPTTHATSGDFDIGIVITEPISGVTGTYTDLISGSTGPYPMPHSVDAAATTSVADPNTIIANNSETISFDVVVIDAEADPDIEVFNSSIDISYYTSDVPNAELVNHYLAIPEVNANLINVRLEDNALLGAELGNISNRRVYYQAGWSDTIPSTASFIDVSDLTGGGDISSANLSSQNRWSLASSWVIDGTRYFGPVVNIDIDDNEGGVIVDTDVEATVTSTIVGTDVTLSATVTAGDSPFTYVLIDDSDNVVQTIGPVADTTVTFTTIDVSSFTPGDYTYSVNISDDDGDTVVEMETFTVGGADNVGDSFELDSTNGVFSASSSSSNVFYTYPHLVNIDNSLNSSTIVFEATVGSTTSQSTYAAQLTGDNGGRRAGTAVNLGSVNSYPANMSYRILNTSASPNVVLDSGNVNITGEGGGTFRNVFQGTFPTNFENVSPPGILVNSSNSITWHIWTSGFRLSGSVASYGVDWVIGPEGTDIPEGSNRRNFTGSSLFIAASGTQSGITTPFIGETITARAYARVGPVAEVYSDPVTFVNVQI